MNLLDLLQYPAAGIALYGAWLVASYDAATRRFGFVCFLISNALWIAWAVAFDAWGLLGMQAAFTITSAKGWWTNRPVENYDDFRARTLRTPLP